MLELKHIKKSFDGVPVLKNINLEIEDGEIVSILGPSGCGKTTLLNIILGLTEADAGELIFQEKDILHVPMEERGFNIVFQDYALFPNLNVKQNITYGLRNNKNLATVEEVNGLINLLGLKEHLDKKIEQLSGGQKQRVVVASTILENRKIICFDEPTSGLDYDSMMSVCDLIISVTGRENASVVITHDYEFILSACNRVVLLEDGIITEDFPLDDPARLEKIFQNRL